MHEVGPDICTQHAAGDSVGEEVPLIDTGLPNAEEYDMDMELGRSPSFKKRKRSKLGLLPLVALIFYEVSGGPFGTEVGLICKGILASPDCCSACVQCIANHATKSSPRLMH